MKRYIWFLVIALVPLVASAQFIGDTMAAAGFAETEDQAPGIAALIAGRPPQQSTTYNDPSHPRESSTTPHTMPREVSPAPEHQQPRESGTYPPGLQPTGTGTPGPAMTVQQPGQPTAPAGATMPAHEPGGYVIGGSGTTYTAEETADWRSSFQPVGTAVKSAPAGSESLTVGPSTFAYSKGIFYQQQGNQWIVVPAPIGAKLKDRPAAASMISHHGSAYWYYNGAFFAWNRSEDATYVVKPPSGIIVTYLPDTATQEMRNGQKVYVYGDTTFKPSFRGTSLVYVAL
jgi:hypothetical protein